MIEDNVAEEKAHSKLSLIGRIAQGLGKTRSNLKEGIEKLVLGEKSISQSLIDEIETTLLLADVGALAVADIMNELTQQVARKELDNADALYEHLKLALTNLLIPCEQALVFDQRPLVILTVGVNGAGKTTTIGKLAHYYKDQGKSVVLAAGDTFRAAAVEQLQSWGEKIEVPVIAQSQGADSASVIYDAMASAQSRGQDLLIADTAGRLQNKKNLMEELSKITRVLGRLDQAAPHEVLLVLDAGTGQNAISQAKEFLDVVQVSGIVLTKLDGTAKGGVIFAIAKQLGIPIRFIGVGEGVEDLQPFSAEQFVNALFGDRLDSI